MFSIVILRKTSTRPLIRLALAASNVPSQTFDTPQPVDKGDKKKLPDKPLKDTDSFALGLFQGVLKTKEVFPYPDALTYEEKDLSRELLEPFDRFLTEKNDPLKNDELERVPDGVVNELKAMGVFGAMISPEFGGLGLKNTQYARMAEVIGSHDLGMGIFMGAHQSIGYKGIYLFGTNQQKKKYLPDLTSGKRFAAFCLTEPSSGSDASSIRTRAVKSSDGKHYVMNGGKIWISNGGIADVFTVFAKTPVADPDTGEVKDKVSAFIVDRSFGGVSSSKPEKKMGIKASNTAEVNFDETKIPVENLLGNEGEGFKVAMHILNNGRFGLAASMSGTMQYVIQKAADWAANRTQFGKKISNFGAIQEKLAHMCMNHYVCQSMAFMIANNMDKGSTEFQVEAAIAKVFCSEAAWNATDDCIQIMGGMGYMREASVERVMRDLRIFRIFEGTNEILRLFTALTGFQHGGAHLKSLWKAVQNPLGNFGVLMGEGSKRVSRMVGVVPTGSGLDTLVHKDLKDSGAKLSSCIQAFAGATESLLLKYGKNIVDEQFILLRVADAAIDIYGMAVTLSRCTTSLNQGMASSQLEKEMTRLFCMEASRRVALNLEATKSKEQLEAFKSMTRISDEVTKAGGVVVTSPLGF